MDGTEDLSEKLLEFAKSDNFANFMVIDSNFLGYVSHKVLPDENNIFINDQFKEEVKAECQEFVKNNLSEEEVTTALTDLVEIFAPKVDFGNKKKLKKQMKLYLKFLKPTVDMKIRI